MRKVSLRPGWLPLRDWGANRVTAEMVRAGALPEATAAVALPSLLDEG
jgi:hypothetical protein